MSHPLSTMHTFWTMIMLYHKGKLVYLLKRKKNLVLQRNPGPTVDSSDANTMENKIRQETGTVEIECTVFELENVFDSNVVMPSASKSNQEPKSMIDLPVMPITFKRKGRPKGHDKTIVGLPKKKGRFTKVVPFEKKTLKDRSLLMLQWFVGKDRGILALEGQVIEEHEIEVDATQISSGCVSRSCNIRLIRKYFTSDAWVAVQTLIKCKEENHLLFCIVCKSKTYKDSLCCSSCLDIYHLTCCSQKVISKSKRWYCRMCYRDS